MAWEVEFTDEFEDWWNKLEETEQIKIDAAIRMLEEYGPDLPYPMSSGVNGSRHSHMRELRVQVQGKPFRVLYAFNPKRTAILLVGGDRAETAAGMRSRFPEPTSCTTSTWKS